MASFKYQIIVNGSFQENCILLSCSETKETIIIDPGSDPISIIKAIVEKSLIPIMILNTHAHFDHIGAVAELKNKYDISFYIHENEVEYLNDPHKNFSSQAGKPCTLNVDKTIKDGDILTFGNNQLKVILTPGHTLGGCCFYTPGLLISGDTLFAGSVGRSDLYGGNAKQLIKSIKRQLIDLPEDTIIIPGHGRTTSIGTEKRTNPFLQ